MKHFKKFNDFISNNVIYHTVYENKDAFIIGNTLYYDNQKLVLNYTPIYESVTKRFVMLNENILSDIGSGIKNVASKVGNFAWDMVKPPSFDFSSTENLIEWAHWLTSSASLLSMIIGLVGAAFSFGTSIAGGAMTAKVIDGIDILIYIFEASHYYIEGADYMKIALPIVFGGISASLLFTTPEGNSTIIQYLQKSLGGLRKTKPTSVRTAIDIILEQPPVKSKFKSGFEALVKCLDEVFTRFLPGLYKLGKACVGVGIAIVKKIGNFIISFVTKCKNAWLKIKTLFTSKADDVVDDTARKILNNDSFNKIFKQEQLIETMEKLGNKEARLRFTNMFGKAIQKGSTHLSDIPTDKIVSFIKNSENLSPTAIKNLTEHAITNPKFIHFCDLSTNELEILGKNKNIIDLVSDVSGDISAMRNLLNKSKYLDSDAIKKLSQNPKFSDILEKFTKNGDYFETFASKEFKKLDVIERDFVFSTLTNNISKSIKGNFKKMKLNKTQLDEFAKKVFDKEGSIVFNGIEIRNIDDFKKMVVNDELLQGLTKTFDIFTWQLLSHTSLSNQKEASEIKKSEQALCPKNNTNTLIVKVKSDITEYIKIKPASERTPEQSTLIKEYLKYIIEASQILKNDNRFKQTVDSMAVNYLDTPKDKESYDLSNEANYVNCAKLFQGYINQYSGQAEKLSVDGAIGEKTLNAAYKFFNEVTMKDKDGKTIKTGTERANKTKELLEKLK